MAYKDFKFIDLQRKFGIKQTTAQLFTTDLPNIAPSEHLLRSLEIAKEFPLTTEKAISEALVSPILQEIKLNNRKTIELFSGERLVADKSKGLTGECDFLFAKSITEAKRGDIDNPNSLAQAAAQLIGARIFNQKQDTIIDTIYGACTSGHEWIFLKLEGKTITIDKNRYPIANLSKLLGVLQYIIDLNTQKKIRVDFITNN